jgi:hypothetical protein
MAGSHYPEPSRSAPPSAPRDISADVDRLEVLLAVRNCRKAGLEVTDAAAPALAGRTGHPLEVVLSALDAIRHQEAGGSATDRSTTATPFD